MQYPIPVTFVLEELNFGGTQRQTLELAARLDRRLFAPRIWTLWPGEELLPRAKEADIPVTALTADKALRPLPAALALLRELRQQRPALLHLCTAFPNVWGRIWGKLIKVPALVASCRGQGNVKGQHERFLWRLAHAHVCNARSIQKDLLALGAPEDRVFYIPNGVDTDFFAPPAAHVQAPEILCVGRMVADKDHETLLTAFDLVRHRLPLARLHLVGDGPLLPDMRQKAEALHIADSVIFHGPSSKVREHMHAARLMVLSSVSEGMPNVLLEGMACALPVVSTSVGGIPDLVQDEKQGLLVAPRSPENLAQAMLLLLEDEERWKRMGQAGREHVLANYSMLSMTRQHEQIYTGLMRKSEKR